jgi:NADH-quinone oxidoreductase subunit J
MEVVFYITSVVAVLATMLAVTRRNPIHALLYLIVSLLAVAVIFFILGAPFVAALEVIIYAGAIMVFFVFVIMLLNLGEVPPRRGARWMVPEMWAGPAFLSLVLGGELLYILFHPTGLAGGAGEVLPKAVGIALYGPYVLGVELGSMLLLAGLVGAYHLGRREDVPEKRGGPG